MSGFSRAATDRDRRRWPYAHVLYSGDKVLIETVHGSKASLQIEVLASMARIQKGLEAEILVDGVLTDEWQGWRP